MEDIKKAYAWREALDLSKELARICEEFSNPDSNVLVWHIRQAVVEIPATIAADLQANRSANLEPLVKLVTELELVRRIYPATDTARADELVEKLMQRLESDRFDEREPEPEADQEAAPEAEVDAGGEAIEPPKPAANSDTEAANSSQGATAATVIAPRVDGVTISSASEPVDDSREG